MATNFDIDLNNNQDNFDIDLNDQVESFVVEFGEITWVTNNDFNKLKNRPSYAGETMTGDTNIPVVPTATSQLTNDANFQNANDLSNAISAHNQSSSAHQDIRQAITDEANIRSNADNGLQSQIDAITSASDVVDIVGTYAELQAYDTQHLKDNDVIKVLQDETHNDAMTYWRWSTHTNTWTYIGAEGPYYTKSETNTLLDEKLDVDEVPDGFFDGPATITPAQGTSVELEKVLKLKSVELLGDTTQQTYSGKNLLPYPYYDTTTTSEGITYTVNSDGTLTINGTWANAGTASSFLLFNVPNTLTLPAGTYYMPNQPSKITAILYDGSSYHNISASNGYKITLSASTPVRRIYLQVNQTSPIQSFINVTFYPMLTTMENPTIEDYEPYTGSTPSQINPSPNPDYPQDIDVVTGGQTVNVRGKNLFNKNGDTSVGSLNVDGTQNTSATQWTTTEYIRIYGGEMYTTSGMVTGSGVNPSRHYYDANKTFISGKKHNSNNPFTDTAPSNAVYMRDCFQSVDIDGIQIEQSSTATTFEPYQSQSYTVDLGTVELCKIGTYQDYIYKGGDDWYVHKEVGKYTFNGNESWGAGAYGTNPWLLSNVISTSYDSSKIQIMSEVFRGVSNDDRSTSGNNVIYTTSNVQIYVRNTSLTTLADIQSATNGTDLYFPLATPTDTQITNSVLIGQLDAVLDAVLYSPTTYLVNSGNLPAILKLEAFTGNLNSLLEIASEPDNKVFVGTDGNVAGKSGLVPAPKTTDDDKYLKSDGTWATVSGGSSVNVVQTVGNSQTDVMSQRAVTSMVFKDPATRYQTLISGGSSDTSGVGSVALGYGAQAYGQQAIAIASGIADAPRAISIGGHANNSQGAKAQGSIALGYGATTTQVGEMNIGSSDTSYGYATSNYRLISGVYDGQNAHDAVTVGQINDTIDAINTALSTNIPHIGAST